MKYVSPFLFLHTKGSGFREFLCGTKAVAPCTEVIVTAGESKVCKNGVGEGARRDWTMAGIFKYLKHFNAIQMSTLSFCKAILCFLIDLCVSFSLKDCVDRYLNISQVSKYSVTFI